MAMWSVAYIILLMGIIPSYNAEAAPDPDPLDTVNINLNLAQTNHKKVSDGSVNNNVGDGYNYEKYGNYTNRHKKYGNYDKYGDKRKGCYASDDCELGEECTENHTCKQRKRGSCSMQNKDYQEGETIKVDCFIQKCQFMENMTWIPLATDPTCCSLNNTLVSSSWSGVDQETSLPIGCKNGEMRIDNVALEDKVDEQDNNYTKEDVDNIVDWYTNFCQNRDKNFTSADRKRDVLRKDQINVASPNISSEIKQNCERIRRKIPKIKRISQQLPVSQRQIIGVPCQACLSAWFTCPPLNCNIFGLCNKCRNDGDCSENRYCGFNLPGCKSCRNKKQNGGWCVRDGECINFCSGGRCTECINFCSGGRCTECINFCSGGRCTECQADNNCPANEFCKNLYQPLITNVCKPQLANGAWCNRNRMCVNSCFLFKCTECQADNDCPSNKYCKNLFLPFITNYCALRLNDGALCIRDRMCKNFCDGARCAECEKHSHCPENKYCKWRNTFLVQNKCRNVCDKRCVVDGNCGYNGSNCNDCRGFLNRRCKT